MTRPLILPGDPDFWLTLGTCLPPVPEVEGTAFIVRAGSLVLEPASTAQIDEYLMGGEYDERMSEVDGWEAEFELEGEYEEASSIIQCC